MIYGAIDSDVTTSAEDGDDSLIVDTNRYDVHPSKLELYTQPDMKKLLKSKFVTGQSQDQIMKNLLNMSDSDEDEEVADRKIKKLKKKTEEDSEEEGSDEE
jgi:DNA-binding response OmpR family regulator